MVDSMGRPVIGYESVEGFAVVLGGSVHLAGLTCALQKRLLTTLFNGDGHSVCLRKASI